MKRHVAVVALSIFGAWLVGCVGEDDTSGNSLDDADSIQQALDRPGGGLDGEDTDPMFGEEDEFAETGMDEEDPAVDDEELAFGPGGRSEIPEGVRATTVLVLWGQLRINPDVPEYTRWDGTISASEGGLIVRRLVRFEPRTDNLLPRLDRQTVALRSVTLPHNDGLILTMVTPPADSSEGRLPPALVVSLGDFRDIAIPARDLADGFRAIIPVDRMGNVIVIATVPPHPCPRGVLAGVWRQVRPGTGIIRGRWVGMGGELRGHVRGIYGTNEEGRQVFFGKIIGRDGRFRGLMRGVWGDGGFVGRWVGRGGEHLGGLRGRYFVHPDGELPVDGVFSGHWVEACHACPDGDEACSSEDPVEIGSEG